MPQDFRDISPRSSNITIRRKSRPPSYNTATRGGHARSPRLRSEERVISSRQVAYRPPYVHTISDGSGTTRETHRTRAPPKETFQPFMEDDDRMRITPSELDEMDRRALASISRPSCPHAPRPPRSRTTPTIGSNSYLSSTYMNDTGTGTICSLDSVSKFYTAPPQSSASHYRHRQPSNNYHSTFPRLLATRARSPVTFSHTLVPVLRDESLFSLPGMDSLEDEDPYLRNSAGEVYYASVPGTYEEVQPFQLAAAYPQPYPAKYNPAPQRSSREFLYEPGRDYNDFTRWDASKQYEQASGEQRIIEGTYRWRYPTHGELPDVEDETFRWEGLSHNDLPSEDGFRRYGARRGRSGPGESPLRLRRGNERLSSMFEEADMETAGRGETEIEVKTTGGTVVKIKKAGRRRHGDYR